MWSFEALCDEFFVGSRLHFKLDLCPTRESVLHLLEQVRRHFPGMARFRRREDGSVVLDEVEPSLAAATEPGPDPSEPDASPAPADAADGARRYFRIGNDSLKFGMHSPPSPDALQRYADVILRLSPAALTLSELDLDQIEVVFGFDLEYAGNHDALVWDTLLADSPLHTALRGERERVIDCQPTLGLALSEDCTLQAYIDIKSRTNTFEVRTGEYQPAVLGVYLAVRRFWSGGSLSNLASAHHEMLEVGQRLVGERVVPHVVHPLAAAIASRR